MYKNILKPILFLFDPEFIHDLFVLTGKIIGSNFVGRFLVKFFCNYENPKLNTTVCGINFKNPVGLAAGFDKNVELTKIIPSVGFGFMEVGAITNKPYGGNKWLRLLRLPKDSSIVVYYGLKNIGSELIEKKLKKLKFTIPVGINIAKTNDASIKGEDSVNDYVETYKKLRKYFAYVTLNISCPNTGDGCSFQDATLLNNLLTELSKIEKTKPIFLKLSCDLSQKEIDEILYVVENFNLVDGFIVGNLLKKRELYNFISSEERLKIIPHGGISGKPTQKISTEMIRYIYKKTGGKYTIIGLGGIFTAEDAYEKIKAGATLVQIITGLIFGGPMAVKNINKGLVRLLERDGYKNISEAIGKE